MTTRWGKLGIRATAGLAVAAAPVAAACSSGPSYEDWAATDGAAGRINLEDVQKAFQESKSATDFEKRVNEIFEGDGIILIKAEQTDTAFVLEGWENLDGNVRIDEGTDEKLFTITQKEDKSHEMRGHYANSYYHSTWGAGDFLFTYLIFSSLAGPPVYFTPAHRIAPIRNERGLYRNSSAYRSQVSRNGSYFNQQKSFAGSSYDSAGRNLSSARQSYQSRARSTGAFRSSGTGVRSSWGSTGRSGFSSGRSGGFFGGGGGQTFLGSTRMNG